MSKQPQQDPLIIPQLTTTQHHHHHHRNSYIVKSLTIILSLTVVVLVINYYLISNCPKDNTENLLMHTQHEGVKAPGSSLVTVSVYYEILCPDSKHFILKQLVPAFAKYSSYLRLRFVPFGKASVLKGDAGYKFTCQHGPEECHGNKLHACIVQDYPSNQTLQLQLIACSMERFRLWGSTANQISDVVRECRNKYASAGGGNSSSNNNKDVMCANADELLATHGYETLALKPAVSFIPTIGVDGSLSNQRQILRDFKTALCETLRNQQPQLQLDC